MKRLFLLLFMGGLVSFVQAQSVSTSLVKMKSPDCYSDSYSPSTPVPFTETAAYFQQHMRQSPATGSNRVVSFTPIGSAGNLFTILDGGINRVDADNATNSVVFIHRANPDSIPGSNVGQFTFDVSTDGGATWSTDNGILNPAGNNSTLAGRYPNAAIYNPAGNTNPNNAYITYLGAWLPFAAGAADWDGYFYGVGKLDGNTATYTADTTYPNNGEVSIARGYCESVPGVFWAVDFASDGTSFDSILLYKGTFSPGTNNTSWNTERVFKPNFDVSFDGSTQVTAINMAFSPNGQYGWIACTGDAIAGGPNAMQPILYNTNDGGATWNGPITLSLGDFDNIQANLNDPLLDNPQTAFDLDIVVDNNGNPHIVTVIGSSTDYAITTGGARLFAYDITRQQGAAKGCEWIAILLDTVQTFRGNLTADISEDNRPQASISPDGNVVVFGWLDSDPVLTGGDNIAPNLITRAYNVNTGLASITENQTTGTFFQDAALFASFSPNALSQGGIVEVPFVVGEINPITFGDGDPAFFHYGSGLDYTLATDFVDDVTPPLITVTGANPLTVVQNTPFVDPGATANDNLDGTIPSGNISANGTVNVTAIGSYTIFYDVDDAAGNPACTRSRIVNVVAAADVTPPTITLVGADTIRLDICAFFTDPGATANDNVDGDITANVVTTGGVGSFGPGNPATPGNYTITYSVTDGAGNSADTTRTLILSDEGPVITLIGGANVSSEICQPFADPGFSAFDNCLGTVAVTVTGTVDTNASGAYVLTYTATDGVNTSTATRTVTITPDVTPPTFVGTNDPIYVYLNTPYTDVLPTADDCSGIASLTSDASSSVNITSRNTYVVTYTATDNNSNVSTSTRTVIVGTEPDPRFTYASTTSSNRIGFTDASLYNPDEWKWDFDGGSGLSTSPNPTYTFNASGSYEVCLEVSNVFNDAPFNRAKKDTCETISVALGIFDNAALETAFNLYPNPTTGTLNLDVTGMAFERMDISVVNTVGQVVKTANYASVQAQSNLTIDLSTEAAGLYLVHINTEQGNAVKLVIMQSAK